jgi:hypothetical protein
MEIDYTKFDQNEVREELISNLKQTKTFKDASFSGTSLYDLANNMSYVSSLMGYYVNQIANEPYINSTKQYKNINRVTNGLLYNPIGKGSSKVNIASSLEKDYVLKNAEGFIEIPAYSLFPSSKKTLAGKSFSFTNKHTLSVQVKQFGVSNIKERDVKYVGDIFDGGLEATKLEITATTKRPVHYVDYDGKVTTLETKILSDEDVDLNDFKVGKKYSLLIKEIAGDIKLIIANLTNEIAEDEIARFYIDEKRIVRFDQSFTNNRLYKGRLGFKNLEYVKLRAIAYPGIIGSVGKIELIVPKYSPAFQVLYKGEVFTFSSEDKDVVISSDRIDGSYFLDKRDVAIVLDIKDPTLENYGARLTIKKLNEINANDVVIGVISGTESNIDERGNLLIEENQFIKGSTKSGVIKFSEGDSVKRVVFEEPYNFGTATSILNATSPKNYSVQLFVNDNLVTYYSDKTTSGFKIHIEDGVGFSGEINWKTVSYEKNIVQSSNIDSSPYLEGLDPSNYTVMVQADNNANVWVRDITESGFVVDSDSAFIGYVDFMIIKNKDFGLSPEPKETGQVYVSKGETEIEVKLNRPRSDANYQLFLQPNDNIKTWFANKSNEGFIINIEPETDFFGIVDWQLYDDKRTGTTFFDGSGGFVNEPKVGFYDLPETTNLGFIEQGIVKLSKVNSNGLINSQVNGLSLDYDKDGEKTNLLTYEILNKNISYNNIRIFVGSDNSSWIEYVNADDYNRHIGENSNVFYVRVNKNKNIGITFGNDDFRGKNPKGKDIVIFGMETVGVEGNIAKGVLEENIISSFNFQLSEIVTSEVASTLVDFLRIKQEVFFNGETPYISDYKGDLIDSSVLKIVQLDKAYNGTDPEGIEDIRVNSQYAYRSQNRLVSKEDYTQAISKEFKGVVEEVTIFNYKEIKENKLFDLGDVPERYYNTLFFLIVPSFGKGLTFLQRNSIKEFLDSGTNKITSTDAEIVEPTFIEIDVIVLYTVKQNSSSITAKNDILEGIYSFFERKNRKLGETITLSNITNAISDENISGIEIQLKRDDNSDFSANDYDVDITPDEYEDEFESIANKKLDDAVKRELRNLIGKGLVELKQPLFDVQKPNGDREWLFVNDIALGKFEFPVLGDVVVERKV